MTVDENKAIARQFFERVINARDLEFARQIVHPDFVDHDVPPPGGRGIDAFSHSRPWSPARSPTWW